MNTLTIDLTDELALWLKEEAAKSGRTQEEIVRAQLEEGRQKLAEKPWMKLVGCIEGPPDLSQRKGYSRG